MKSKSTAVQDDLLSATNSTAAPQVPVKNSRCAQPTGSAPLRRAFLFQVAGVAGGIALALSPGFRRFASAAEQRNYAGYRFALEIERVAVGQLRSIEGGFPRADVISEPTPSGFAKKHLGPLWIPEIVAQIGMPVHGVLADWIGATLNGAPIRKSGAILTLDFDYKMATKMQFSNAIISGIGFPAFDASSKQAGILTLKIAPEMSAPVAGDGSVVKIDGAGKQQEWLSSNFRLTIPVIDCTHVSKIEAFEVKQTTQPGVPMEARSPSKAPGRLEISNLTLQISEQNSGSFYAWYQDMVVKGNGEKSERDATLQLLDRDTKTVLQTLNFHNVGICAFAPVVSSAVATESIRRVQVELYCERMTFGQAG